MSAAGSREHIYERRFTPTLTVHRTALQPAPPILIKLKPHYRSTTRDTFTKRDLIVAWRYKSAPKLQVCALDDEDVCS
jgi:hypothetical protein